MSLPDTAPAENGLASRDIAANPLFAFLQMLVVLAVVIALIWVTMRFMKSLSRGKGLDTDAIRVLGTKGLTPTKALHIVSVGKAMYLLGSGEGGISLVSEIKDQEFIDAMLLGADQDERRPVVTFQEAFREALGIKKGAKPAKPTFDFLSKQRDRLGKL